MMLRKAVVRAAIARTEIRSGRCLIALVALVGALGLSVAPQQGQASTPDAGAFVTGYATPIERQIELTSQLGVGWVTLPISWSFYEYEPEAHLTPGTDQYERWERLGDQLAVARAGGLKVMVTFMTTPPWAQEFADARSGPAPDRYADFAQFVDDLTRRYGSQIDAYATWNEPNIDLFWLRPDPAAYARLHVLAASTIRANDPTATVVLGPIAGNASNAYSYLTAVYENGVKGTVNRVGWNVYPPGAPWVRGGRESYDGFSTALSSLLRRLDPGRRVWLAETGWSTCRGCPGGTPNVVSASRQADYLLSALAIKRRYFRGLVDRMFVYSLADGPDASSWSQSHGLVRVDFTRKSAYNALRGASKSLAKPKLRWRRTAAGEAGAIRNLILTSRRGVVRAAARLEPESADEFRVLGYWRGRWRTIEKRPARSGGALVRIPDVGYRAIRAQIGTPGSSWVVAQLPVPAGPNISSRA